MLEQPWIRNYDAGIPAHLDYPTISIQELLDEQAAKYPDRVAIVHDGESINYRQLGKDSRTFAANLIRLGLKPGDRVGICLPNIPQFVIAYYGILIAGGIVAAINPAYPKRELEYQANIAGLRFIIGLRENELLLKELIISCALETIILFDKSHDSSQYDQFASFGMIQNFDSMLQKSEQIVPLPYVSAEQPALFQFSGGTTGTPKAAVALHKNIIANVFQFKQWLSSMQDGKETFLTVIPLYHVYGMVIGLNVGIAMGATIVLNSSPKDLKGLLEQIQKHSVTFFPGVPSLYHAITHFQPVIDGEYDLSTIKACISGSAPLLQETRIDFEKLTGGKLVEGYGLSEAPTATHCNPINGENRTGSIGLPLPDVECRIVNLDDSLKDVLPGEQGELLIRSPQIMQGYYKQPVETAIAIENGWLHTGDVAWMDEDGYFYLVGRKKELIKVGGLQVWPIEVEEVLMMYPGIAEVVVAGIPDPASGEFVRAWIVPKDTNKINLKEVQRFCEKSLASYKIPREIECVETFPRTSVGKILRRELVRKYIENKKSGA
jgi:long-chain acyl-CoA synthetase